MKSETRKKKKSDIQHITHSDHPNALVVVHPPDGDRFTLRLPSAILGCQSMIREEACRKQADHLLGMLRGWVVQHNECIARAILTCDSDGLLFAVVRKGKAFDPDFEDMVAQLELDVAQNEDFELIRMRAIGLPFSSDETIASFVPMPQLPVGASA